MSQEMMHSLMKRTCNGCGASYEWDMIGMDEEVVKKLEEWYTVVREVFFRGQFEKMLVHACSLPCVPVAAVKLALPPQQDEPEDNIDIASLRAANYTKPN
jgi:hypothetical protein